MSQLNEDLVRIAYASRERSDESAHRRRLVRAFSARIHIVGKWVMVQTILHASTRLICLKNWFVHVIGIISSESGSFNDVKYTQ